MKISEILHPRAGSSMQSAPAANSATGRVGVETARFAVGDLIKAKVLAVEGDGRVTLDVNGVTLSARSAVPLTVGRELWLEIGSGGSLPLLALAAKKGAVQDLLKLLLSPGLAPAAGGENAKGAPALPTASVAQLVGLRVPAGVLAAPVGENAAPERVKLLVSLLSRQLSPEEDQGGLLAALAGRTTRAEPPSTATDLFVRILTAHQEVNSQPPQPGNQNFFLFPCFFTGSEGWGEWLFSQEKADAQGSLSYSVSFFLEMSALGPLSIHVSVRDAAISGELCPGSEKACRFISERLPELNGALADLGYRPVALSCRLQAKALVAQLAEKLEQKASLERFSLVDLNV
ncbi:MAG: hypothetical protein ACOY32_13475 [Thermodesulfobacteriota bacterium]